jgi:AcrR family transcriptional regulator
MAKKIKTVKRTDYHHRDLKRGLMLSASELLEDVGYEEFTLRKCATRAGVTQSAPRYHFKDAAGLLTALAVEGFDSLSNQMREEFIKSREEKVNPCRAVAIIYLSFARKNPALYRVMFGSKLHIENPEFKSACLACFEKMQISVAEVFKTNEAEVNALSVRIWTSLHGYVMLYLEHRLDFLIENNQFQNFDTLDKAWLDSHTVPLFEANH